MWAGLVPPFSAFFNAVLSHYQIHMMHLGPQSITLLAVFAFVCEAMVGIPPSVALLRHFFSLCLTDPSQCLGCVSFQAVQETAASGIDFSLPPSASGFRERWLYVDVGVPSVLLALPTLPAIPNPGWDHEELTSPQLAFTWHRFERLREIGVTAPKVVKEFLQCRIAPLQRHSRPMWTLTGHQDCMRLQERDLAPETLRKVLKVLTGDPSSGDIRHGGGLLYLCSGRAEFARQMPRFDEWGLRPADLVGPRENPVAVAPPPVAHVDLASGGGAGRQASLEAGGSGVEMPMSRGLPRRHPPELAKPVLRLSLMRGRNLRLPRPKPPRPRQATKRWHLIAPLRLVPLM